MQYLLNQASPSYYQCSLSNEQLLGNIENRCYEVHPRECHTDSLTEFYTYFFEEISHCKDGADSVVSIFIGSNVLMMFVRLRGVV